MSKYIVYPEIKKTKLADGTIIERLPMIYAEDIIDENTFCPYCGDVMSGSYRGCCGEVHGETGYILPDDTMVLASEVYVSKIPKPIKEEV